MIGELPAVFLLRSFLNQHPCNTPKNWASEYRPWGQETSKPLAVKALGKPAKAAMF
jgi:hypothetical protein